MAELKIVEKGEGSVIESWENIHKLASGNSLQKRIHFALKELDVFSALSKFSPMLVGDSALGLGISESKIKIICQSFDLRIFLNECQKKFGTRPHAAMDTRPIAGVMSAVCTFKYGGLSVWITAQEQRLERQQSYLLFSAERRILTLCNDDFRKHLENIRETGLSLDWAFANTFKLTGDPRRKLAELAACTDVELREFIAVREKQFLKTAKIAVVPKFVEPEVQTVAMKNPGKAGAVALAPVQISGNLEIKKGRLTLTGSALRSYPPFKTKNLLRLLVLEGTAVTELLVKVVGYNPERELEVEMSGALADGDYAVIALWPRRLREKQKA